MCVCVCVCVCLYVCVDEGCRYLINLADDRTCDNNGRKPTYMNTYAVNTHKYTLINSQKHT